METNRLEIVQRQQIIFLIPKFKNKTKSFWFDWLNIKVSFVLNIRIIVIVKKLFLVENNRLNLRMISLEQNKWTDIHLIKIVSTKIKCTSLIRLVFFFLSFCGQNDAY